MLPRSHGPLGFCLLLQVRLCNDADAAILAEQWVGTASGIKNFLMLSTLASPRESFGCDC